MKNLFCVVIIMGLFIGCNSGESKTDASVKGTVITLSEEEHKSIINREISTWEFAKQRNFDKMKEIMRDDYQAYFGKNILNLGETIASFQNSTMHDYRLYNIKVKPVSANTAIVYYNLRQHVTGSEGDKWIPEVASSTVYIKDNGEWRSVFYHETPMGE